MTTETWFWTTADGLRLHARTWRPQGPPKAVIALLHGLGSHLERHTSAAEALSAAGYVVAGYDQRGFGRSQGRRGHTPSLQAYLDDIAAYLDQLSRRWPGLPQVLYGHSMGALLALAFTLTRRSALAGVIATSPALRSRVAEQGGKVLLVRLFGRLLPTLSLDNGLDLSQLSRDPAVQARVEADPLCHRRVTTAWGRAMLQAIALVEAQPSQFPVPLLLMHGRDDAIAYPCGSQRFAAAAPAERVTLQLWEGFRHELHSDPEREQVFARMVAWLDRQVAAAGSDRWEGALIGWSGC
jgi:alpha-beta hydrolase superfamily lysophospholipase